MLFYFFSLFFFSLYKIFFINNVISYSSIIWLRIFEFLIIFFFIIFFIKEIKEDIKNNLVMKKKIKIFIYLFILNLVIFFLFYLNIRSFFQIIDIIDVNLILSLYFIFFFIYLKKRLEFKFESFKYEFFNTKKYLGESLLFFGILGFITVSYIYNYFYLNYPIDQLSKRPVLQFFDEYKAFIIINNTNNSINFYFDDYQSRINYFINESFNHIKQFKKDKNFFYENYSVPYMFLYFDRDIEYYVSVFDFDKFIKYRKNAEFKFYNVSFKLKDFLKIGTQDIYSFFDLRTNMKVIKENLNLKSELFTFNPGIVMEYHKSIRLRKSFYQVDYSLNVPLFILFFGQYSGYDFGFFPYNTTFMEPYMLFYYTINASFAERFRNLCLSLNEIGGQGFFYSSFFTYMFYIGEGFREMPEMSYGYLMDVDNYDLDNLFYSKNGFIYEGFKHLRESSTFLEINGGSFSISLDTKEKIEKFGYLYYKKNMDEFIQYITNKNNLLDFFLENIDLKKYYFEKKYNKYMSFENFRLHFLELLKLNKIKVEFYVLLDESNSLKIEIKPIYFRVIKEGVFDENSFNYKITKGYGNSRSLYYEFEIE